MRIGLKIAGYVSAVIFTALIVFCIVNTYKLTFFRDSTIKERYINLNITVSESDSSNVKNSDKHIEKIKSIAQLIDSQYKENVEKALNDIREETNYNIDKISAWLSFWLTIITLIGGLIPLFLSWKYRDDTEKHFDILKSQILTNIEDCKNVKQMMDSTKVECLKQMKEIEQDYSSLKNEIDANKLYSQLIYTCNTLIAARENRLIDQQTGRDMLQFNLVVRICDIYRRMVEQFRIKANKTDDDIFRIEIGLIQIHALYTSILPCLVIVEQTEQMMEVLDRIIQTVININERNYADENNLVRMIVDISFQINNMGRNLCINAR